MIYFYKVKFSLKIFLNFNPTWIQDQLFKQGDLKIIFLFYLQLILPLLKWCLPL